MYFFFEYMQCDVFCSLGIGPFVNPTFLRTLAGVGRGYSDICLHPIVLQASILQLMNKSTCPLLMDITVAISHDQSISVEVYPFPIPDLFAGCPVAIAGCWSGTGVFPASVTISGRSANGEMMSYPVVCRAANTGYLDLALGNFHIDSIVSAYWMKQASKDESKFLKQKAIDLSIQSSIPCVFTQSVAYETR